jgi:flagellar capping protein FliD
MTTAISPVDTSIITFKDPNTELIFEINREGQIIIGKGYTPTEAADIFLERLSQIMPGFVNSKTEFLQKENDTLNVDLKRLTNDNEVLKRQLNEKQFQLECWVEDYYRMQNQQ